MRRPLTVLFMSLFLAALPFGLRGQDRSQDVVFLSQGEKIHAVLFRGSGDGPRPTVLLLHGFPGGERDLFGLGALISAEGWNVLAINYRGMFKNEGLHTPSNTLADAVAALDYLQNAGFEFVAKDRFAAIGYSYGGWVALLTAARDPRVSCVAGIGAGNLGVIAQDAKSDPEKRAFWEKQMEAVTRGNPARGVGGEKTVEEILAKAEEFDIVHHGETLSRKPVLLIGGWRDRTASLERFMLPISRAIEAVDGIRLTAVVFDDDHVFRNSREKVQSAVRTWLRDKCGPILREK